jgi:hypothetical protein
LASNTRRPNAPSRTCLPSLADRSGRPDDRRAGDPLSSCRACDCRRCSRRPNGPHLALQSARPCRPDVTSRPRRPDAGQLHSKRLAVCDNRRDSGRARDAHGERGRAGDADANVAHGALSVKVPEVTALSRAEERRNQR